MRELGEVRQRVSTGLRIAGPKDEAAGYVISRQLRSQMTGWDAALDALARGQATVSVARTGIEAMSDVLIQVRQTLLSLSAATGEEERFQLREQVKALVKQSDAIVDRSTYNDVNLLNAEPPPPPPPPPPQPADFLLPFPTAPGSGKLNFTLDAGMLAGRVILELDLGAAQSEVEIYQGAKRQAATTRSINSGGPARPASGVQVIGFDYDPTDGNGQTLSFRFNDSYAGSNGWRITALRMEYPPPVVPSGSLDDLSVLAAPDGQVVRLNRRALRSNGLDLQNLTTEPVADALRKIEAAIETVNAAGGEFGSVESELDRRRDLGARLRSTLDAQVGAMVDADLAREDARLTALLAREQLATLSIKVAGLQARTLLDLFKPQDASPGRFGLVA